MKRFILPLFCSTLFFIGCYKQPSHKGLEMNYENIVNIPFPNIEDSFLVRYSTFISDIKYVKLEDTPNSLIGSISQLEIANNGDFIVFDVGNNIILRFDSCGHYLNAIGERGHGPQEYVAPYYISYDPYLDEIMVSDHGKQKILCYNLSGEKVNEFKTPYYNCAVQALDDEHLLFYRSYSNQDGFNFIISKRDASEYSFFDPLPQRFELDYCPDMMGTITHGDDDKILCRPPFSSIIYQIDGTKVTPKYQIETDNWRIGKSLDIEKVLKKRQGRILHVYESNNILLFDCSIGGYGYTYIYNVKNGTSFAGKHEHNDVKGHYHGMSLLKAKGKRLYSECLTSSFEVMLKNKNNGTDTEFLKKGAEGNNPWIMICTVKN